jgi:Predicted Zn-dependent protease (DUF2268)
MWSMAEINFLETDEYSFPPEIRSLAVNLVAEVEPVVRARLPMLPRLLNLTIDPTRRVIPETGHSGFTLSKDWIRIGVNPWDRRGVASILRATLVPTFAHEAAHAARYAALGSEAQDDRVISVAVFEGLATVFQGEVTPARPPWTQYDEAVIDDWLTELLALPPGSDPRPWRFRHPDGRRWIVYRAGTRLVERAKAGTGRSASDMTGMVTDDVVQAADLPSDEVVPPRPRSA